MKSYVVGHEFEIVYELTNVGLTIFPGGNFSMSIEWPNGQGVGKSYQIPKLGPRDSYKTPSFVTEALSRGFALFVLRSYASADGRPINLFSAPNEPFPPESFYSILAKEPEEIYQFWAMIIAAVSLVFLVGIEVIRFLIWLLNYLNRTISV